MRSGLPVLVYDGACGFCKYWILFWRSLARGKIAVKPYQECLHLYPQLSEKACQDAVQLVDADGTVRSGADAVFWSLNSVPVFRWLSVLYAILPGFSTLSEWAYSRVARNRVFFSALTRFFRGPSPKPSRYLFATRLFLNGIAGIYFITFIDLWRQAPGLWGSNGILPLTDRLTAGSGWIQKWLAAPSLFWLSPSDWTLHAVFAVGVGVSVLAIWKKLKVAYPILWFLYLSIVSVGGPFMQFQWDNLLLEAGFLACFLAYRPGFGVHFLFRLLLFRLMLASGWVKILSGEPSWINGTALFYHFETQPLPNVFAWIFHQLPHVVLKWMTLITLFLECILPFGLLLPRRFRVGAALLLGLLQVGILVTGNFGFFNWLSLGLCLIVIDDATWMKSLKPKRYRRLATWLGKSVRWGGHRRAWITVCLVTFIMFLSVSTELVRFTPMGNQPNIRAPIAFLSGWRLVNPYGLFSIMTKERIEIDVYMSWDGIEYEPLQMKFKPDDVRQWPAFIAPFHPRLDWQFWFLPLGSIHHQRWVMSFLVRLLEGSEPVYSLLDSKLDHRGPPTWVRADQIQYEFVTIRQKLDTPFWWRITHKGSYLDPVTLKKQ